MLQLDRFIHLRISHDTLRVFDGLAKERRVPRAELARMALEKMIAEHANQKTPATSREVTRV